MPSKALIAVAVVVVIAVIGAGFVLMQQPAPQQAPAPAPKPVPAPAPQQPAPAPPPFVPQSGLQSAVVIALNARGDINLTAANKALSGEGIIADKQGRLYTADRVTTGDVYMIDPKSPKLVRVATVPKMENTPARGEKAMVIPTLLGLAFDKAGNLYIAGLGLPGQDPQKPVGFIFRVAANKLDPANPGVAEVWATGVPGANGIAFDSKGNLYVSGRNTIYRVTPAGGEGKVLRTGVNGTNGIAFSRDGTILWSANSANGSIWRIELNQDGTIKGFTEWLKDPKLAGIDGIQLDVAGNIWGVPNRKNALVAITPDKRIIEVAKNDNKGPLEFPASMVFSGKTIYIANTDGDRDVNSPRQPGVGPSIAKVEVGIEGLPLPP
ncbi:MAG: SMP-30/gluconolactonase/LRE family protein [Thaumarchaeota archaeon]|nr:SMP-30/gluconolactonase/LRE family protein [Nitrososphaerota archaeon]